MLIPTSLQIMPGQERRIHDAFRKNKGCKIHVRHGKSGKQHMLGLNMKQLAKLTRAQPGSIVGIPFTGNDLKQNRKMKGGFLGMLLGALAPLAIDAIAKAAGAGIKMRKKRKKIGKGLHLAPWPKY